VKRFTDAVGYQGSYNLYSGVAHAEPAGLWRLFRQTGTLPADGAPVYDAGPDPRATFSSVDGALKAMMGCMTRIVFLFGWTAPGRSEEAAAWIDHNNDELAGSRSGAEHRGEPIDGPSMVVHCSIPFGMRAAVGPAGFVWSCLSSPPSLLIVCAFCAASWARLW